MDVIIPVRTSFTDWNEATKTAYQNLAVFYGVPVASAASLVAFGAAFYHLFNLLNWDEYVASLRAQNC